MVSIKELVQYLIFETVIKKPQETIYRIYEKDTPMTLVTKVNGIIETTHNIQRGDVILTGPNKEKWGMSFKEFLKRYDIKDGKAYPRPIVRKAACVSKELFTSLKLPNPYSFEAPWKETMYLKPGDYLIKDKKGYYRVEKRIFHQTYQQK